MPFDCQALGPPGRRHSERLEAIVYTRGIYVLHVCIAYISIMYIEMSFQGSQAKAS